MFKYLHILLHILILDGLDSDSGSSSSGLEVSVAGTDTSCSSSNANKPNSGIPLNPEDMQQIPFQPRDGQSE